MVFSQVLVLLGRGGLGWVGRGCWWIGCHEEPCEWCIGLGNVHLRIVDDEIAFWSPTGYVQVGVFEEKSDGFVVRAEGDAAFGFVFCGDLFDCEVLFFGGAAAVGEVFGVLFRFVSRTSETGKNCILTVSSVF